jgi:hypothetical protein
MKRVSDKMRIILAISVICFVGLFQTACGAKKVNVPLDAAQYTKSNESDSDEGDDAGEEEEDASAQGSGNACQDLLAEQRKSAKLSRTEKCEKCLCDKCADEFATIIEDGTKAINVVTCAEKNKVTGQCLACKGPCMNSLSGILTGGGDINSVLSGPCVKEVCTAGSLDCSSIMNAYRLLQVCVSDADNPCGHAMALSDCLVQNCPSPTCAESTITCQ